MGGTFYPVKRETRAEGATPRESVIMATGSPTALVLPVEESERGAIVQPNGEATTEDAILGVTDCGYQFIGNSARIWSQWPSWPAIRCASANGPAVRASLGQEQRERAWCSSGDRDQRPGCRIAFAWTQVKSERGDAGGCGSDKAAAN